MYKKWNECTLKRTKCNQLTTVERTTEEIGLTDGPIKFDDTVVCRTRIYPNSYEVILDCSGFIEHEKNCDNVEELNK